LTEDTVDISKSKSFDEYSETNIPFVFLEDESFALHINLLKSYGEIHLNKRKRIFTYRLSRARRYVECAFDTLVNK
jgi:hypothetical protein